jgi:hypothetical protein
VSNYVPTLCKWRADLVDDLGRADGPSCSCMKRVARGCAFVDYSITQAVTARLSTVRPCFGYVHASCGALCAEFMPFAAGWRRHGDDGQLMDSGWKGVFRRATMKPYAVSL